MSSSTPQALADTDAYMKITKARLATIPETETDLFQTLLRRALTASIERFPDDYPKCIGRLKSVYSTDAEMLKKAGQGAITASSLVIGEWLKNGNPGQSRLPLKWPFEETIPNNTNKWPWFGAKTKTINLEELSPVPTESHIICATAHLESKHEPGYPVAIEYGNHKTVAGWVSEEYFNKLLRQTPRAGAMAGGARRSHLGKMTVKELREAAKSRKIKKYYVMCKAELIGHLSRKPQSKKPRAKKG